MSDTELRDTKTQSRKGRKPKGDVAMTSAERKRLQREREQRQREKENCVDVPGWLRLRREIFQLVQRHYMLTDVGELSHALEAVGVAIKVTAVWQDMQPDDVDFYLNPLATLNDPTNACDTIRHFFYNELLNYEPGGHEEKALYCLFRDIPSESRKGGDR